jgi:hypothetical protein
LRYILNIKTALADLLFVVREVLVKWGYYLELKGEADRLLEVTRSRFPGLEVISTSQLGMEITVQCHSSGYWMSPQTCRFDLV